MVVPVRALQDDVHLPGFQIDRVHFHRPAGRQPPGHHRPLVLGLHQAAAVARHETSPRVFTKDAGSGHQRLVGVDRRNRAPLREVGQFPGFPGVQIRKVQGALRRFEEEDARSLPADGHHADGAGDDDPGLEIREVDDTDAVIGGGERHLPAVRRVGVDVEVKAVRSGFIRQADDAMAGFRIDPGLGRVLGIGRGREANDDDERGRQGNEAQKGERPFRDHEGHISGVHGRVCSGGRLLHVDLGFN